MCPPFLVWDGKVLNALLEDDKKDFKFEYAGEPVYQAMANTLAQCFYEQPMGLVGRPC